MKSSADFKQMARDALHGNWKIAILTGFVASLLGGASSGGGSSNIELNDNSSSSDSLNEILTPEAAGILVAVLLLILAIALIWGIITFIIGGACKLGYTKFNLNLIDGKPAAFSDLFSQFGRFGDGFLMELLRSIYIFLWTLLFIIPGIIKEYSYAMTPYILLEHPEMSANDAITESRSIMDGNKWRLFCLRFSFIGWTLLAFVPMIICSPLVILGTVGIILYAVVCIASLFAVDLFLRPYQAAAEAAFYRDITLTYYLNEQPTEENINE